MGSEGRGESGGIVSSISEVVVGEGGGLGESGEGVSGREGVFLASSEADCFSFNFLSSPSSLSSSFFVLVMYSSMFADSLILERKRSSSCLYSSCPFSNFFSNCFFCPMSICVVCVADSAAA